MAAEARTLHADSLCSTEPIEREKIERFNHRHSLALRASRAGVWEYDLTDGSLLWDQQMYRLYGITEHSFSGAYEAWEQGFHPDDLERGRAEMLDAIDGNAKFDTDYRVVWPGGEIRHIRALADVHHDDSGRATHMVGVNWDITEQKKLQNSLLEANESLRHFSHISAHHLREPCRRLQGIVNLIREDYLEVVPEELQGLLDSIHLESEQMSDMIDSFRVLAGLDAQPLVAEKFSIEAVFEEVIHEFSRELTTTRVLIDVSAWTMGYKNLVKILLRNVISNAVKYGSADMTLSFYSESLYGGTVYVVENTCDPVEKFHQNLFHPLVRGNSIQNGQGFGLSICKRVVEMHGGAAWIEPRTGKFCLKFNFGARDEYKNNE